MTEKNSPRPVVVTQPLPEGFSEPAELDTSALCPGLQQSVSARHSTALGRGSPRRGRRGRRGRRVRSSLGGRGTLCQDLASMTGTASVDSFHQFLLSDSQLHAFGQCIVHCVDLLNVTACPSTSSATTTSENGDLAYGGGGAGNRVALVVDAEDGLDRLYGGYYSDWCCGGQWANMMDFLSNMVNTFRRANVHVAFFFNGAPEPEKFTDWRSQQLKVKENVAQVFRHIHKRGTPPPKVWWVAPSSLQTVMRMVLKTLNCQTFSTLEDHHQEVMSYCWENGYHGIMADNSVYALTNPPRYFSLRALKMTFQMEVSTDEYIMDEVAKSLNLNPNRFGLLAALLGNHLLTRKDLRDFHHQLAPELRDPKCKIGFERVIRGVVAYIRALPKVDDFHQMGKDIFGSTSDARIRKLKASLQYYMSCTQDGYGKHRPKNIRKKRQRNYSTIKLIDDGEESLSKQTKAETCDVPTDPGNDASSIRAANADLVERIALDLDTLDIKDLDSLDLKMAISDAKKTISVDDDSGPKSMLTPEGKAADENEFKHTAELSDKDQVVNRERTSKEPADNGKQAEMSVLEALTSGVDVAPSEEGKYPGKKQELNRKASQQSIRIPVVHKDVFRTCVERHRHGQMCPYIYQLLTRGEIKLPVVLEDLKLPDGTHSIHRLFQPLRQRIYAVIFNLNHQKFSRKEAEDGARAHRRKADEFRKQAKKCQSEEEKSALLAKADTLYAQAAEVTSLAPIEVRVREWTPYNDYSMPEVVPATELPWSVPTVERLWFGNNVDDKQRRLRAFLSCLRCDDCPLLLTQSHVPQHMLLLACVLRYLMTSSSVVNPSLAPHNGILFSRAEFDAVLATAFSPELRNPRHLADMKLDLITKNGVQLATIITQGLEMGLMANDACGAPVPMQMCLPWTFFDGKLFQYKLRRADMARNLVELCDGQMEIVCAIERMRTAIMQGLMLSPLTQPSSLPPHFAPRLPCPPRVNPVFGRGQMMVAGTVVGQWGCWRGPAQGRHNHQPQHMAKKKKAKKVGKNSLTVTSS